MFRVAVTGMGVITPVGNDIGVLASQFLVLTILRFLQAKILGLFSMAKRQNSSMQLCGRFRSRPLDFLDFG